MNGSELRIGNVYTLIGKGEMRLERLTPGKTEDQWSCVFLTHGNCHYYAFSSEVLKPATKEDVELRQANARVRGVECRDPECWCRFL